MSSSSFLYDFGIDSAGPCLLRYLFYDDELTLDELALGKSVHLCAEQLSELAIFTGTSAVSTHVRPRRRWPEKEGDKIPCKVTPAILHKVHPLLLHGVVSPDTMFSLPCRIFPHGHMTPTYYWVRFRANM